MAYFDYLIIGGSAAGTTAAENIRNLAPNAQIAIITEEPHRLYSRILLPFYLKDKLAAEQLFLKPAQFYSEKNINLITSKRVVSVKPADKKVRTADGEEFSYSKLLLATGGKVNKWPSAQKASRPGGEVGGAEKSGIFYLRTYEDGIAIREVMREAKKAVVIGGGFISLEFTTSFVLAGIDTTVLVRDPYYWANILDEPSGNLISKTLKKNGAKVLTNEEVAQVEGPTTPALRGVNNSQVKGVLTKKGQRLAADMIGVGVGIHIDLDYLAGSEIATRRGILTNEFLETNVPDVFAAGDAAEFYDILFGRRHMMGNWANAVAQGEAVALNMIVGDKPSLPSQNSGKRLAVSDKRAFETASTYSINFFEGNVSFVGVADAKAADNIVVRGKAEDGSMCRILLKNNRIIGATLVNRAKEQAALVNLVKKKVDVGNFLDKLKDSDFDLAQI